VSLIQVSPILSIAHHLADIHRLYATLSGETLTPMKRHEAAGTMDTEEYQNAVMEFAQRYMMRMQPKPEASQRARQGVGNAALHGAIAARRELARPHSGKYHSSHASRTHNKRMPNSVGDCRQKGVLCTELLVMLRQDIRLVDTDTGLACDRGR
jgi:hypothetical protein